MLVSGRVILVTRSFWCLSIPSRPSPNKNLNTRFIVKKICANVTVWWGWIAILQSKPTLKNHGYILRILEHNSLLKRLHCICVASCFHLVGFKHFLNGSELYLPGKAPLFGMDRSRETFRMQQERVWVCE